MFWVSELHSEPSTPVRGRIRLSSSIGLEVNCSGGSFSGLRADRILPSKELQTDSFSSTGGRKFNSARLSSFPAWLWRDRGLLSHKSIYVLKV